MDYASALTPDEAVDRLIISGTPEECIGRLRNLFQLAARHGFSEITIGVPLGPDVPEAIDLWGNEILPSAPETGQCPSLSCLWSPLSREHVDRACYQQLSEFECTIRLSECKNF